MDGGRRARRESGCTFVNNDIDFRFISIVRSQLPANRTIVTQESCARLLSIGLVSNIECLSSAAAPGIRSTIRTPSIPSIPSSCSPSSNCCGRSSTGTRLERGTSSSSTSDCFATSRQTRIYPILDVSTVSGSDSTFRRTTGWVWSPTSRFHNTIRV